MSDILPADIEQRIQHYLASGEYATEADVLRDAFSALDARREDLLAVREGLQQMKRGEAQSLDEVAQEIRVKHGWSAGT